MGNKIIAGIFYFVLLFLLVFEGWGVLRGRDIVYHFLLFTPFILLSAATFTNIKTFKLPHNLTVVAMLFTIFLLVFTLSSVNIQQAFEGRFIYIVLLFFSFFIYNYQKVLKHYFPHFLSIATITTLFMVFFSRSGMLGSFRWIGLSGPYQFLRTTTDAGHDILGAFILIPLSYLLAKMLSKTSIRDTIATFLLLGILLTSLLRASYIALLSLFLFVKPETFQVTTKKYRLIIIVIILCVLTVTTNVASYFPSIQGIRSYILEKTQLTYKKSDLLYRLVILQQAGDSIIEYPLTGIGSFNYYYSSLRFAKKLSDITGSSHNIFIDIAVENGIPAFIFFTIIVLLLLTYSIRSIKNMTSEKKAIFAIFFVLFILFSLSHYHKMHFLLSMFFVAGALIYNEKRELTIKLIWVFIPVAFITVVNIFLITAKIALYKGDYKTALSIYPLNSTSYQVAASAAFAKHDTQLMNFYLERYAQIFPNDPYVLDYISSLYQSTDQFDKAFLYRQKTLELSPLDFTYLMNLTEMIDKTKGHDTANEFISTYIDTKDLIKNNPHNEDTEILLRFCKKHYNCTDN